MIIITADIYNILSTLLVSGDKAVNQINFQPSGILK